MAQSDTPYNEIVQQWLERCDKDKETGTIDLLNFVVGSCGFPQTLVVEDLSSEGDINMILGIPDRLPEVSQYPISNDKKARKRIIDIWNKIFDSIQDSYLYEETVIPITVQWLTVMSSSNVRALRHTSTFIALKILTKFCEIIVKVTDSLNVASQQQNKSSQGSQKRGSKAKEKSDNRVEELEEKLNKLKKYLDDIYSSVFVNRFRDIFGTIRAECIHELAVWIETYPDHFLDNNHLKFIDWGLSDKDSKARKESIEALKQLYNKETYILSLENLTNRFKARIISMLQDVDYDVRILALQLAVKLFEYGRLDEQGKNTVRNYLIHRDPTHRHTIAPFITSEIKENFIVPKKKEYESLGAAGKKFNANFVTLKAVIDYLVKTDISEGIKIACFVDAVWNSLDIVQDWKTMAELLLTDTSNKVYRDFKKFLIQGPDEEATLARLLVECLKKGCDIKEIPEVEKKTAGAQKKKVKKETDSQGFKKAFSAEFANFLPELFNLYKSDALVMMEIIEIPQLMDLEVFSSQKLTKEFSSIPETISQVIEAESNPDFLNSAAKSLGVLQKHESLTEAVNNQLAELISKLIEQITEVQATIEKFKGTEADFNELLSTLNPCLNRLSCLINHTDFTSDDIHIDQKEAIFEQLLEIAGNGERYLREKAIKKIPLDDQIDRRKMVDEILFSSLQGCRSLLFRRFNFAIKNNQHSLVEGIIRDRLALVGQCEELMNLENETFNLGFKTDVFGLMVSTLLGFPATAAKDAAETEGEKPNPKTPAGESSTASQSTGRVTKRSSRKRKADDADEGGDAERGQGKVINRLVWDVDEQQYTLCLNFVKQILAKHQEAEGNEDEAQIGKYLKISLTGLIHITLYKVFVSDRLLQLLLLTSNHPLVSGMIEVAMKLLMTKINLNILATDVFAPALETSFTQYAAPPDKNQQGGDEEEESIDYSHAKLLAVNFKTWLKPHKNAVNWVNFHRQGIDFAITNFTNSDRFINYFNVLAIISDYVHAEGAGRLNNYLNAKLREYNYIPTREDKKWLHLYEYVTKLRSIQGQQPVDTPKQGVDQDQMDISTPGNVSFNLPSSSGKSQRGRKAASANTTLTSVAEEEEEHDVLSAAPQKRSAPADSAHPSTEKRRKINVEERLRNIGASGSSTSIKLPAPLESDVDEEDIRKKLDELERSAIAGIEDEEVPAPKSNTRLRKREKAKAPLINPLIESDEEKDNDSDLDNAMF